MDEEFEATEIQSVGERLRVAREEKGFSLEDIAAETRIPHRHLESLEAGHWERLPAPTYTIGFAKSYASAVGLDRAQIGEQLRGEMGGRPLEAMALIGLGVENFSITPAAVGPLKAMVRSLDVGAIRTRMQQLLVKPPHDMRRALNDWARRHRVVVG